MILVFDVENNGNHYIQVFLISNQFFGIHAFLAARPPQKHKYSLRNINDCNHVMKPQNHGNRKNHEIP